MIEYCPCIHLLIQRNGVMAASDTRYKTPLTTLPNELLICIMSYTQKPKDLLALVLVSYRFQQLAETLLYRDICLVLRASIRDRPGVWADPRHSYKRLIRKLSRDESLAENVFTLSIRGFINSTPTLAKEYQQLITILPRLRSLTLRPPYSIYLNLRENTLLFSLHLDFRALGPRFPAGIAHEHTLKSLEVLSFYILLPSLRVLEVDGLRLGDRGQPCNFPITPGRSSNVTNLKIACCSDEGKMVLSKITSCIGNLKSLTLHFWNRAHPTFEDYGASAADTADTADTAHIGLAVLNQKEHLIELAVASSGTAYFRPTPPDFGNFQFYLSLKRLAIPEHLLLNPDEFFIHQRFPPHVEELQLEYCTDGNLSSVAGSFDPILRFERLDAFAIDLATWTPKLRRVIWWHQYPHDSKSDIPHKVILLLKDLRTRWDKQGVEFGVFMSCNWHDTPFATRTRSQEPRSFCQSSTVGQWLDFDFFW